MSVRKNWLFALGTVLFSAFLAFALLEVGARMMFPELADDETFHQLAWDKLLNSHTIFSPGDEGYSKRFGFQYSKNAVHSIATDEFKYTVRTNSLGFRSNELTPKGEEEYRVLLLGDSFFGVTALMIHK